MPVGKRIVVKPEDTSANQKIIIANQKPTRFQVISVGEDVTKCQPKDLVYLDKYSGVDIEYEGQKYIIIEENNILARVKAGL